MAITVGLLVSRKFRARQKFAPDMAKGIELVGDKVVKVWAHDYQEPFSDVLVFYGFDGSRESKIAKAFNDYKSIGKPAIYVDLGYFSQRWNGDRYGFHRFAVNDRHPTKYFQDVKHKGDRFKVHNRTIEPWRKPGRNIVVAGMSEKCAVFEGFKFEEWERNAIRQIRNITDRPIVYRPKPQRKTMSQYPAIEGVSYSNPLTRRLAEELQDAWCVVSHHSNAGIDALLAGVPCFTDEGVSTPLAKTDVGLVEFPYIPSDSDRRQLMADISYCQFNRPEMRDGTAWRHFKSEGLVP